MRVEARTPARATATAAARAALTSAALLAEAAPARAARPMVVDDARIVDHKACQVESWLRDNRDGTRELWSLPACNLTGRVELTLGGARTLDPAGGANVSDVVVQAKGLWRALPAQGWGTGAVVGNVRHPDEPGTVGGPYGYWMLSASTAGGRFVAHLNLGAAHDRAIGRTRPTWGVGTEIGLVGTRLQLLGEVFGVGDERPFFQAGFRWWVVPERLQLDATWGDRWTLSGTSERFVTLGVRVVTPPFLP